VPFVLKSHQNDIIYELMSPIMQFINDESVQEIMVNKPHDVWIESCGVLKNYHIPEMDESRLHGIIVALGRLSRKDISDNDPIVDTKFEGHRVAACLAPIAVDGHALCMRKHTLIDATTLDYATYVSESDPIKSVEQPQVDRKDKNSINEFLGWLVTSKKNFIVSGGTSSAKTSFLRAMLKHLFDDERVITVEDPSELNLKIPNTVRFEVNQQINIDIRRLIRLCLRFRPDRIFVGEIRGLEAYDFMSAANSGHDGTGCSMHANNPIMALEKLADFALMGAGDGASSISIKNQIAYTFDYVIQMRRIKGVRTIETIHKVLRHNGTNFETEIIF
jgi:Flp pilus assembly CpaF family ATPase